MAPANTSEAPGLLKHLTSSVPTNTFGRFRVPPDWKFHARATPGDTTAYVDLCCKDDYDPLQVPAAIVTVHCQQTHPNKEVSPAFVEFHSVEIPDFSNAVSTEGFEAAATRVLHRTLLIYSSGRVAPLDRQLLHGFALVTSAGNVTDYKVSGCTGNTVNLLGKGDRAIPGRKELQPVPTSSRLDQILAPANKKHMKNKCFAWAVQYAVHSDNVLHTLVAQLPGDPVPVCERGTCAPATECAICMLALEYPNTDQKYQWRIWATLFAWLTQGPGDMPLSQEAFRGIVNAMNPNFFIGACTALSYGKPIRDIFPRVHHIPINWIIAYSEHQEAPAITLAPLPREPQPPQSPSYPPITRSPQNQAPPPSPQ